MGQEYFRAGKHLFATTWTIGGYKNSYFIFWSKFGLNHMMKLILVNYDQ